jgi:SAM-dependent methyltransferase
LSSLVSEHLTDLRVFFRECFAALRPGGRFVFSAFHPDPALGGVEANFERDGVEYRLGAERYTVDDYLARIDDAGFARVEAREYAADARLVAEIPAAAKHLGRPLLLLVRAERAT